MAKFLHLILIFSFIGCSSINSIESKNINESKRIRDNKNDKMLSVNELIQRIRNYDVIIIGEYHDNLEQKKAQIDLISKLNSNNTDKEISVAFEMLGIDKQKFIDKAKQEKVAKENLQQALHWEDTWIYDDYKGLIEMLFYSDIPIIAANLPESEHNDIIENKVNKLQGELSTSKEVQNKIKSIISSFHPVREEIAMAFLKIQQHKDRVMAETILNSEQPIILITGMYHASKSIGIPLHLQDLKSNKKVAVISLDDGENFGLQDADFTWFFN